jgi:lambda family phage minor tail protein L
VIHQDIQKLDLGARVEFYQLDATSLGGSLYSFHAGTNNLRASVVWQGVTYSPWPIEATGFDKNGRGQLPTPKVKVANFGGLITALTLAHEDLIAAKFIRRRTLAKYLDAVNFPGGVNASADPTAELPLDIFYIERKTAENRQVVEFDLSPLSDVEGLMLPRRQATANVCFWVYRSSECSYAGGPVAKSDDTATSDPTLDVCGKRVASCKLRFGDFAQLPYGGFPASRLALAE